MTIALMLRALRKCDGGQFKLSVWLYRPRGFDTCARHQRLADLLERRILERFEEMKHKDWRYYGSTKRR